MSEADNILNDYSHEEADLAFQANGATEIVVENQSDEFELNKEQEHAIESSIYGKLTIISGGAGVGKTTIIKEILGLFEPSEVLVCSFTGKSAARIKELTGANATTAHRMLAYMGPALKFTLGNLEDMTVIIDECSMLPDDLFYEIMKRNPQRLILLGDASQLPPVGLGSTFHDLIKIYPEKVCWLEHCYRNSEAIFKASMHIRKGHLPGFKDTTENEHFELVAKTSPAKAHKDILDRVEADEIDFDEDIILCPRNGSVDEDCSVIKLNKDIVDFVNPREGNEKFKEGDRVINTKNFSAKDIWNGTTGKVLEVSGETVTVKLDTPAQDPKTGMEIYEIEFSKEMVKELKLAYALTIHKAQGSQYNRVFFLVSKKDSHLLLNRALIYTAITRAMKECYVIGDLAAFQAGIKKEVNKRTALQLLKETN